MPIRRRYFNAGAVSLAFAGLARPALADSSPVIIGYPAALTGPSSAPGVGNNRGAIYAASLINAAGGVKGRQIELMTRDTQGDPMRAVNAVQEMMGNAHVDAIWGPNNSGESLATTPIITRRRIPNVHICGVNQLIDPQKYPQAFRIAPNNAQCAKMPRRYCRDVLKITNVAVVGDSTGYGTMMVTDSVADAEQNTLKVLHRAQIDATQPDMTPDMLRMRTLGVQAVIVWTVSTGMVARLLNARAAIGWDVPVVGHSTMGSGDVGKLLDKPSNWKNVYIYGTKSTTYDASGRLPDRVQAFVDRTKDKIRLDDTTLWWVLTGADAVNLIAAAVAEAGPSPSDITNYWNAQAHYPGLYANYSFSPENHDGFPDDELVMSDANSGRNGAFALAPT